MGGKTRGFLTFFSAECVLPSVSISEENSSALGGGIVKDTEVRRRQTSPHNNHRTSCAIPASALSREIGSQPWLNPWKTERSNFLHPPATYVGKDGDKIVPSCSKSQKKSTDPWINNWSWMDSAVAWEGERAKEQIFSQINYFQSFK